MRDVTEILTCVCARLYGRRAAANRARAPSRQSPGWRVKVTQAYRFALEPTPAQERALRSHAGAARFAWNWGLAKCEERYDAEGKWHSAVDLHRLWNAAKKADPALAWWGENSKCAYQEAFRDLDRALRTSSSRRRASGKAAGSGFPRFKKRGKCRDSFRFARASCAAQAARSRCPGWVRSAPTSPPGNWPAGWRAGRPASCRPPCPVLPRWFVSFTVEVERAVANGTPGPVR